MDNAIKGFLLEKKAERIKKKTNSNMTSEEILAIEHDADDMFLLDNWLPNAAKRASQLSLTSHPSKFSHPHSKTTAVIAESKRSEDGFLRTGNVNSRLDASGNAGAMDVFKFLSLILNDGKTLVEHLEENSEKIKADLKITSMSFEELRSELLSIKEKDDQVVTSGKVKQVYFPVSDNYHLLSILTPSGLIFELKNRIQAIHKQAKKAREDKRKNSYNDSGFDELRNLSVIGYGGAKPRNISILNHYYGGKTYLLPSLPPLLTAQSQRLPKNNFFTHIMWPNNFKEDFIGLHKLLKTSYNNKDIRHGLTIRIESILNRIIEKMWSVRLYPQRWPGDKIYSQLPYHQKIWLDNSYEQDRQTDDQWLDKVIDECAHWIIMAYKKILGKKAIPLADVELTHIKTVIEESKDDLR